MPWLTDTLDVETIARIVLTLFGIFGTLWAGAVSHFFRVRRAAYTLSRVTLETRPLPKYLLPRESTTSSILKGLEDPQFRTVLVYGNRGSGKTTAIEASLRERSGVLDWTLAAEESHDATTELQAKWEAIFQPWSRETDREFAKNVCTRIAATRKLTLVVVIAVEIRHKPEAFRSVLFFCKSMAYNKQMVRFVVDISSSRTAVALQTKLSTLRLLPVLVGRLTRPDALSLISRLLPESWTPPMVRTVSLEIVENVDPVMLDLSEVCEKFQAGMNHTDAMACLQSQIEVFMSTAYNRMETFYGELAILLNNIPGSENLQSPPLVQDGKLILSGVYALQKMITFPKFLRLVSDVGAP